ncbi:GNAT family N-acetyltransferase [Anaerorhabdus sp.]|uniref:GNAT family N-acetyltransferase n=1 Tax=Anaerorhabdus sp. TaxID=1872524 RepID=UPI002FCAA5C2
MKLNHSQGSKVLATKRCICRPIREVDKTDLFNNINHDQRVLTYFLAPYCENILDYSIDSLINRTQQGLYIWVIEVNQEVIGFIIEQIRDENARSIELGYGIGFNHWNKGYITEVMSSICTYLFDSCHFHKISLGAITENSASIHVMEKLGFQKEGVCIDELYYHDQYYDVVYYYKINPTECSISQ